MLRQLLQLRREDDVVVTVNENEDATHARLQSNAHDSRGWFDATRNYDDYEYDDFNQQHDVHRQVLNVRHARVGILRGVACECSSLLFELSYAKLS